MMNYSRTERKKAARIVQLIPDTVSIHRANVNRNQLVINGVNSIHLIRVEEIEYCRADGNYTEVYLLNGDKITTANTLKSIMSRLPMDRFQRIHQSFVIQVRELSEIRKSYVILRSGSELNLSRRKRADLLNLLE